MPPIAKAIVSSVRPKASATPANPMPRLGKAAARTALPHPPRTSQNVPMSSAASRFERGIFELLIFAWKKTKACVRSTFLGRSFRPFPVEHLAVDFGDTAGGVDLVGRLVVADSDDAWEA